MSVNRFVFSQNGNDTSAAVLSTPAELNLLSGATAQVQARVLDASMEESIAAVGALSVSKAVSKLAFAAGGAVTLAAPSKPAFVKVIKMTVHTTDVTLALTNVVGGSAATTATFSAVGQTLVLVSDSATSGKWIVLKEQGVVLS